MHNIIKYQENANWTSVRSHYTLIRLAKIKETVHTKSWQKGGGIGNFIDCYSDQNGMVVAWKTHTQINGTE